MAQDPYKYFRIEAQELLDELGRAMLDLGKRTTPDTVARLLRLAHTLKGAARVVKCGDIAERAHAVEEVVQPLRTTDAPASPELIDALLVHMDAIGAQVAALPSPAGAHAVENASVEEPLRTVRTNVLEVEALLDGIAEAHVRLGTLRSELNKSADIRYLVDLLTAQLAPRPGRDAAVDAATGQARALVEQLADAVDGLGRSWSAGVEQVDRELKVVHEAADRMRLVPTDSLFLSLERTVRDAAQALGKEAVFEAHGGDLRVDGHVLSAAHAALVQAVRNAVAHGIETADERRRAGKPTAGRVSVEVIQRGSRVEFACADDGRGINDAAVRRVATQKGLLSEASRTLNTEALLKLLLEGGISTSAAVTGVSGRGIGLDVVRDAAVRTGGKVSMQTETGRGTRLMLTVPLTLSALNGLLVEADGQIVAIPMDAVQRTIRVAPDELERSSEGEALIYEGARVPFLSLAQALATDGKSSRTRRVTSVVIVEAATGTAAVGVDRLLGAANIVLRALPELAPAADFVTGASLDADGNPLLVLDPANLVTEARRNRVRRDSAESIRPPILIVDDSLTTRMLERSILESAGYDVELASSGEEALEKAHANRYALFLVDVEMPGMDGFSFIERTRADQALRQVPAILVTSRNSPDDLQRGKEVGAHAYIVKGNFDQSELLARIEELLT